MNTIDENRAFSASRVADTSGHREGGVPPSQTTVEEIRTWLESTDLKCPLNAHSRVLSSYLPGTGNWILASDAYIQWHDSAEFGLFWANGALGTGKSVWAASMVHRLTTEQVPVLYFCFHQAAASNCRPHLMVRIWMCQLLKHSKLLQSTLSYRMQQVRNVQNLHLDGLWSDLQDSLYQCGRVYCVVDALDEANAGESNFISHIVELGKLMPRSIKLIITSRSIPTLEEFLKKPTVARVQLAPRWTKSDVESYIESRLTSVKHSGVRSLSVHTFLSHKAQGLFLYARLAIDTLVDRIDHGTLEAEGLAASIENLPPSLDQLYATLLAEHSAYSGIPQDQLMNILGWLTYSARPLRLLETAELIRYTCKSDFTLKEGKHLIRNFCGRLLEISQDETVSVIHRSLYEVLAQTNPSENPFAVNERVEFPRRTKGGPHDHMALICIEYVNASCLEELRFTMEDQNVSFSNPIDSKRKDGNYTYPFLHYAENNWYYHASRAEWQNQSLFSAVDEFFELESYKFSTWARTIWPNEMSSKATVLHISAYCGLDKYTRHIFQFNELVHVDAKDEFGRTPLSYAARHGHAKVVEILLENGAELNTTDIFGYNPVHLAVEGNFHQVVKLLLPNGVDPCTRRVESCTTGVFTKYVFDGIMAPADNALNYASEHGLTESLLALAEFSTEESIVEALCRAAVYGRADAVALLLSCKQIPVDIKFQGKTPLYYAAASRDPTTIAHLLHAGADPNTLCFGGPRGHPRIISYSRKLIHGEESQTPMHAFAGALQYALVKRNWKPQHSEERIKRSFQLLIEAGGSLRMLDKFGRSVLHHCAENPDPQSLLLIKLFLSAEAGKDLLMTSGRSPLHDVRGNCPEIIELLVNHGADINLAVNGCTPLHSMLIEQNATTCLRLLEYKPNCNASDNFGNTPLHTAMASSSVNNEVIIAMLRLGADPNHRNNCGQTPMHVWNYRRKHIHLMPMLLNTGADPELQDEDGRPFLFCVLHQIIRDIVGLEELLQSGLPVHPRDRKGRSILHHAVALGAPTAALESLVRAGANPNWVDHAGNNIFHEVVRKHSLIDFVGEKDRVMAVVSVGTSLSAVNYSGQTSLHLVAGTMPSVFKASNDRGWEILSFLMMEPHGLDVNSSDRFGCRPIHYAASVSEYRVNGLVENGADPTTLTNEGLSPLHIAAISRQSNIIGYLVHLYKQERYSGLVDLQDRFGRTALHYASKSGRPESVEILLNGSADPNIRDQYNMTPLHAAAEFPEENVCWGVSWNEAHGDDRLDARGLVLSDKTRPAGHGFPAAYTKETTLQPDKIIEHDTVRIIDVIRLLLSKGADMEASGRGNMPIDIAISKGCTEMVNELGRRGQKARNSFRQKCLSLEETESSKILAEHVSKDENALFNQLLFGGIAFSERLVKEFFHLGADPLKEDQNGMTPLHIFAKWGYDSLLNEIGSSIKPFGGTEMRPVQDNSIRRQQFSSILDIACQRSLPNLNVIRVLVEKLGVDPHAGDALTALHLLCEASYWWQLEAIEFLISSGVDIEGTASSGETPLHVAAKDPIVGGYWKTHVVEILLKRGGNPNALDAAGRTCLSKTTNLEVVKLLVAYGADINAGKVPAIFYAVYRCNLASVELILDAGADINARVQIDSPNLEMPTGQFHPLHLAVQRSYGIDKSASSIVELLLQRGADLFASYEDGSTVWHSLVDGNLDVERIIDFTKIDLERKGREERSLLLSACESSRVWRRDSETQRASSLALLLLDCGANAEAVDCKGRNALHYLCELRTVDPELCWMLKFKETVPSDSQKTLFRKLLRTAGHLIHCKDVEGWKPIHRAISTLNTWFIDALVDMGDNVLDPDPNGDTVLHHLAPVMCEEGARGLFSRYSSLGIPINTRDNCGETPLFRFVSSLPRGCTADMCQSAFHLWIDAGADIYTSNSSGETLLHALAKYEYSGYAAQYLLEAGLDPLRVDSRQRTAIDVAMEIGNKQFRDLVQGSLSQVS